MVQLKIKSLVKLKARMGIVQVSKLFMESINVLPIKMKLNQAFVICFLIQIQPSIVPVGSFRISEVRHFGLKNLPCEKTANFRNGGKMYRTRTNVVVFTANIVNLIGREAGL